MGSLSGEMLPRSCNLWHRSVRHNTHPAIVRRTTRLPWVVAVAGVISGISWHYMGRTDEANVELLDDETYGLSTREFENLKLIEKEQDCRRDTFALTFAAENNDESEIIATSTKRLAQN